MRGVGAENSVQACLKDWWQCANIFIIIQPELLDLAGRMRTGDLQAKQVFGSFIGLNHPMHPTFDRTLVGARVTTDRIVGQPIGEPGRDEVETSLVVRIAESGAVSMMRRKYWVRNCDMHRRELQGVPLYVEVRDAEKF